MSIISDNIEKTKPWNSTIQCKAVFLISTDSEKKKKKHKLCEKEKIPCYFPNPEKPQKHSVMRFPFPPVILTVGPLGSHADGFQADLGTAVQGKYPR